jgi:hypothetical protein
MVALANMLSLGNISAHIASSTLGGLRILIEGTQAILRQPAFLVGIILFSLFIFLIACFVLVGCILVDLAVLFRPSLRSRAAGTPVYLPLPLPLVQSRSHGGLFPLCP